MQDLVVLDLSGTPTWIAAEVVKEMDNRFKTKSDSKEEMSEGGEKTLESTI